MIMMKLILQLKFWYDRQHVTPSELEAAQLKDYLTASSSGSSGPSTPQPYGHAKSVLSTSASAMAVSLASSIFSSGRSREDQAYLGDSDN